MNLYQEERVMAEQQPRQSPPAASAAFDVEGLRNLIATAKTQRDSGWNHRYWHDMESVLAWNARLERELAEAKTHHSRSLYFARRWYREKCEVQAALRSIAAAVGLGEEAFPEQIAAEAVLQLKRWAYMRTQAVHDDQGYEFQGGIHCWAIRGPLFYGGRTVDEAIDRTIAAAAAEAARGEGKETAMTVTSDLQRWYSIVDRWGKVVSASPRESTAAKHLEPGTFLGTGQTRAGAIEAAWRAMREARERT
jgi:hypothetical protein